MSGEHHHHVPPSAAGFLDPYGLRAEIGPASGSLDSEWFLRGLLEDVAAACEAEGATVIGHLKCFLRSGEQRVHCNLTSKRTGAACGGSEAKAIALDPPIELHLAVLVYGLSHETVARLVQDALDHRLSPLGVGWRQV
jgi:hypothetical protein